MGRALGGGGRGIVYEAEQLSLGRTVALKILPPGSLLSPRRVARFRREAQAAANLHHTNIVPVFGAGEHDGLHYYVMQAIGGRGLDAILAEEGSLAPRRAAEIALAAARALAYAHGKGTLHRDIKPANLLLDEAGTAWITDFGLAKALSGEEDLTNTGDFVGTVRYMAPERFEGRSDERSDIYGLGLTLYEMLTGRPAFSASDPAHIAERIRGEEPPAPRRIDPEIPRDLETITLTAIARDPDHRYPSAEALAEDLARALEDRPIRARRAGPAERLWRWCRRNRTVATLFAVAAASVLLAAAAGWTGYLATTRALTREEERRVEAEEATTLAEENVELSLTSLQEIFDTLTPAAAPRTGPGAEEAEAEVLQSVLEFYDRFAELNAANPRLRREAARSYQRISALRERMGDDEAARAALSRAVAELEKLVAEFPDEPDYRLDLAEALMAPASRAKGEEELRAAEASVRKALEVAAEAGEGPDSPGRAARVVRIGHARLALVLARQGRADDATAELARVGRLDGGAGPRVPGEPELRVDLAQAREAVADLWRGKGRRQEARDLLRAAIADLARGHRGPPAFRGGPRLLAGLYAKLAATLRELGDDAGARDAERRAMEQRTREGRRPGGPGARGPGRPGGR